MFTKLAVTTVVCWFSTSASWAQPQADVVTTAPRKFHAVPQTPAASPPVPIVLDGSRLDDPSQRHRDPQAQQFLNDELSKLQRRCQKLAPNSTEMVRCQAKEAAVRRELARLP